MLKKLMPRFFAFVVFEWGSPASAYNLFPVDSDPTDGKSSPSAWQTIK
jgi:hypothetical protein